MEAGNDLEHVRAWIGHRSVQQTNHYWERTQATLATRMCVPWVQPAASSSSTLDGLEATAEQYELAVLLDERRRQLEARIDHLCHHVLTASQRAALEAWERNEDVVS